MTETRTVVTHDSLPIHVAEDANAAFAWLLNHQGQSVHYATTHGGYSFEDVPVWDADKARELGGQARQLIADPWHQRGHDGENDDLTRSNCGSCALAGYRGEGDDTTDADGPNYSGWVRVYVEARRPIPSIWRDAMRAELRGENRAYADGILRDVATFGIRYSG